MTREQTQGLRAFIWLRIGIWAIGGGLWTVTWILAAIFTPLGGRVLAIWNTPRNLVAIEMKLDRMQSQLDRATGEDRVIRQTPGLSYVQEPVHQGDPVVFWIVAERTTLGRDCKRTDWTPIFSDESNVMIPGRQAGYWQPLEEGADKRRIDIIPPATLQPGRIQLFLALDFDCDGKIIHDRTDVVAYKLLPVNQ